MLTQDFRKKKLICAVVPNLRVGGAERVLLTLLEAMSKDHYELRLIVLSSKQPDLMDFIPHSVEVSFLNIERASLAIFRLSSSVRSIRPDILFVNLSYLSLLVAIFRPLFPRSMICVARESSTVSLNNKYYRFPRWWDLLYRIFYRKIDHIVCQSEQMAQDLEDNYSVPRQKISVVGNPVDVSEINKKAKLKTTEMAALFNKDKVAYRWRFTFVGGLRPEKNVDGLLRALSSARFGDVRLYIVGGGHEAKNLMELADTLGIAGRVFFTGPLKNPYPYVENADALLLTSHHEGLPNIILEALALDKQIISTPAGGVVSDLLHNDRIAVVAKDSTDGEIAKAVDLWIDRQPNHVKSTLIQNFDTKRILKRYEAIFDLRKL